MEQLHNYLLELEKELSRKIGFLPLSSAPETSWHQFIFAPPFDFPSILVVEQTCSMTTIAFAIVDLTGDPLGRNRGWQNICELQADESEKFKARFMELRPDLLPDTDTTGHRGLIGSYTYQKGRSRHSFEIFNPDIDMSLNHRAWLCAAIELAQIAFVERRPQKYLRALSSSFSAISDK